jgi:FtsH-binding integral membrane protein
MSTAALSQAAAQRPIRGRRYDNYFFSAMVALIFLLVVVGFARTYFLAGVFRAPLPAPIIHLHGALFTAWILLLITQTSLVSAGRVDIHRKLGMAGFALAVGMVIVGLLAATNSLTRNFAPPGLEPLTFYIIPLADMVMFGTLTFFAYRARFDPAAHKRLILLATVALMDAPTGRPPFSVITGRPHFDSVFCYLFIVLLIGYDWWSTRKVHKATIWGSVFLFVITQVRVPIGFTGAWHNLAGWVQTLARG